jgi:hypothetical protein
MRLRIWLAWHGDRLVGAATVRHELRTWLRDMKRLKGALWPPLDDIRIEVVKNRSVDKRADD